MKTKVLFFVLLTTSFTLAAYISSCRKDDNLNQDNALITPISVSFSRDELLGLLANSGDNEVAGLCFMPVPEGDHINLQAVLAEWNTSEDKPSDLIKVMDKSIMGHLTNDPCAALTVDGTTEFGLVYFEKSALLRFLDEEHYYPGLTQKPSGVYFSRTMLELESNGAFQKYRGLVARPYPLPDLSNDFADRQGAGYYVVPTCPPFWRPMPPPPDVH